MSGIHILMCCSPSSDARRRDEPSGTALIISRSRYRQPPKAVTMCLRRTTVLNPWCGLRVVPRDAADHIPPPHTNLYRMSLPASLHQQHRPRAVNEKLGRFNEGFYIVCGVFQADDATRAFAQMGIKNARYSITHSSWHEGIGSVNSVCWHR